MRKTIPLDNLFDYLITEAIYTRRTGSKMADISLHLEKEYNARAREIELMALQVLRWKLGEKNHIFKYYGSNFNHASKDVMAASELTDQLYDEINSDLDDSKASDLYSYFRPVAA